MALHPGPDGLIIPFGTIVKVWESDLDDGLPSWLTLDTSGVGAGASTGASTEPAGGLACTTAASVSAEVRLQGTEFDLSEVEAARISIAFTGGYTSGPDRGIRFGFLGAAAGAHVAAFSSTGGATRFTGFDGVATVWDYDRASIKDDKVFTLSFTITTADQMVHYADGMDDEQNVISYAFGADMGLGTVRPIVRWISHDGAAQTGHLHKIVVTRWWR